MGALCQIRPSLRKRLHFFDQPIFPAELNPLQTWCYQECYSSPFSQETQSFLEAHCRTDDFGRLKKPLHDEEYWKAPVTLVCRYSLLEQVSFYDHSGLIVHSESGRVVVDGAELPNWKQCKPAPKAKLQSCPYETIIPVRRYSNYSHFLLDCGVPLVRFLMENKEQRSDFALAIASRQPGFVTQFLSKLCAHYELEQFALLPNCYLQAPRTLAFEVEGPCSTWTLASPALADELRTFLIHKTSAPPTRKVYLHRDGAKWRNLENSEELMSLLKENEFEIFTPNATNFLEQVELMSETSLLVSGHGAALTNMLFMPEGGTVLELFPAEFQLSCYPALAGFLGLQYHHLIGEPTGTSQNYTLAPSSLLEKITDLSRP